MLFRQLFGCIMTHFICSQTRQGSDNRTVSGSGVHITHMHCVTSVYVVISTTCTPRSGASGTGGNDTITLAWKKFGDEIDIIPGVGKAKYGILIRPSVALDRESTHGHALIDDMGWLKFSTNRQKETSEHGYFDSAMLKYAVFRFHPFYYTVDIQAGLSFIGRNVVRAAVLLAPQQNFLKAQGRFSHPSMFTFALAGTNNSLSTFTCSVGFCTNPSQLPFNNDEQESASFELGILIVPEQKQLILLDVARLEVLANSKQLDWSQPHLLLLIVNKNVKARIKSGKNANLTKKLKSLLTSLIH